MKQKEKYSTVMDLLIIVFMAVLFAWVVIFSGYAMAGPYVDVGAYYGNPPGSDMLIDGNTNFPWVLKAEAGYAFDNGFYVSAVHFSNPQAQDRGLNIVGGGYRYEW